MLIPYGGCCHIFLIDFLSGPKCAPWIIIISTQHITNLGVICCERLVGAHRESSSCCTRASSCHKIFVFVCARGCCRVVAQEGVLVTRSSFLCLREAVVVRRESSYCARGVSVRWAQRELSSQDQAKSGPIPIRGRLELIFVQVVDRTHVRESVCVFLWPRDDDK